jgi:hypothetical protein
MRVLERRLRKLEEGLLPPAETEESRRLFTHASSPSSSSPSPPHFWQQHGSQWRVSQLPDRHLSQHLLRPLLLQIVAARSSMTFTGSNGSSLLMTSSHALG